MIMFYAVKVGRKPGLYETMEECISNIIAFPGAEYQSFYRRSDAYIYLGKEIPEKERETPKNKQDIKTDMNAEKTAKSTIAVKTETETVIEKKEEFPFKAVKINEPVKELSKAVAYVDGSYNESTKTFGFGGYVLGIKEKILYRDMEQIQSLHPCVM